MSPQTAISGKELWFRYAQDGADVVRGLTLTVRRGEFLALLGGNGTGTELYKRACALPIHD